MPLYSYHIFLFPFKWEIHQGKKHLNTSLVQRTKLSEITKKIDEDYWQPFVYQPQIDNEDFCNYGEYAYFYDHARDVLNLNAEYEGINLKQYRYKGIMHDALYDFSTKHKQFSLEIEDVLLNLYENGVGVLSLFLRNNTYDVKEDIFLINDFGRRIYPQYLGNTPLTDSPKGSFLASQISLSGVHTWLGSNITEDFSHYDSISNLQRQPFILPKHIIAFLGVSFQTPHPDLSKGEAIISPIIDDRMFTVCIYYNQALLDELAHFRQKTQTYGYQQNTDWYKYIFVDGGTLSCHSELMKSKQLTESTYDRWLDYRYNGKRIGQLFGASRYSFVVLAAPDDFFNRVIIRKHVSHQYFQLVLLSLVQRAYLINFSGEVARISQSLSGKASLFSSETRAISQLYLLYIRFVNRVYFREVTPQEQGIELYELIQTRMRIREEVKDLDTEISELNTYAEAQQQNRLTLIAGRFLPPSLVAGILGMNGDGLSINIWTAIGIVLATLVLSNFILYLFRVKK